MKIHQVFFNQHIPIALSDAWDFFSSPQNLKTITPPQMNFTITSSENDQWKMYEGMLISYKVSPVLGIAFNWLTEITHVREGEYFVDEQRSGPFSLWHHEHHFEKNADGVYEG